MRIGELSRRTGVAVPTIKYYLRDGLLPPGELTSRNQAQYGEDHVERLRLVRALIEVGGLPVATVRMVLDAAGDPEGVQHNVFGKAIRSITHPAPANEALLPQARAEVVAMTERLGWRADPAGPAGQSLASVLATFRQIGYTAMVDRLDDYARAVEHVAAIDMEIIEAHGTVMERLQDVVVANVVGDVALMALRRLAQEHGSALRFESVSPTGERRPARATAGSVADGSVADGDGDADGAGGAAS